MPPSLPLLTVHHHENPADNERIACRIHLPKRVIVVLFAPMLSLDVVKTKGSWRSYITNRYKNLTCLSILYHTGRTWVMSPYGSRSGYWLRWTCYRRKT